jgi:hypothetical protein
MKYALLTEVLGRWKAEIVESFLKSEGIDVVLVEDAVAQSAFANPFAPVQIFVPKENLEQARELAASLEDVLQNDEENDEDDTGGEQ